MSRPITLFTGQWADLPFEEVCRLASGWGYDGLEIACWGDHLDVVRACRDDAYLKERRDLLERYGLRVWAISNHLAGQAVCDDPIDARHRAIVSDRIWGDGNPEGVRTRAAEELVWTARAAARLGVDTVVGFTGSAIWKYVAMFPPVPADLVDAGYQDFADRWNPILDVFDEVGVRFAHEVHPSEIQLGETTGIEIVNYRISGTWGPLGHGDPFFAGPALIHAAARGERPDLSGLTFPPHAEDALDLCYVKDTARAITLLQLADRLEHRTYNIGSGRATSNAEIAAAIRTVVPDADVDLPHAESAPPTYFDIGRLTRDTGYRPEYDTERAADDYIAWLRAGNQR